MSGRVPVCVWTSVWVSVTVRECVLFLTEGHVVPC